MGIDINKFFPYNKMKLVTVDGQQMLRIPRIYVKNEVIGSGAYAGKVAYFMNESPCKGYHLHPAFMNGGSAMSALDLSCYEASKGRDGKPQSVPINSDWTRDAWNRDRSDAWQAVTQTEAVRYAKLRNTDNNNPDKSGWHCWDIYCHHLLARIMLFEFGTTSFIEQPKSLPETIYRGIHQPAGNPEAPLWLPGIMNINGMISVADNMGSGGIIQTGLKVPANGWPTAFSMIKGNSFDLGDLFIATTTSNDMLQGTCSDYQKFKPLLLTNNPQNIPYFTAYRGPNGGRDRLPAQAEGMFAIDCVDGWTTTNPATTIDRGETGSVEDRWAIQYSTPHYDDDGGPLRFRLAHWVK